MRHVFLEMEKLKNLNSGLGQFCMNIGKQFQLLTPKNLQLDFYLPSAQNGVFGDQFNYLKHTPLHKFLPIDSRKYDVWHCLQQESHYLPNNKKSKFILTIHDLNFLDKYRGAKQKRKLSNLQKKIEKATALTVISKFTESVVRKHLEINVPVHLIYNGYSLKKSNEQPSIDLSKFSHYLFSIGIISEKKNFHVLVSLLEHFDQKHLVIAGDNTSKYAQQILALAKTKKVSDRLHLIGNIDENNKYHLYKNCEAFLFPSKSEGFGLPVIEAMSLGKPTFLSSLTSLPEVGGKEAYYWDSFEVNKMIEVVENGLKNYSEDPQKAERIIEWTKQFSWENAAKAYLDLYETV